MFSRIRYAAHVLSYSPPKVSRFDEPDVTFEEECRPEVSKASARIGSLIEVLLFAFIIGVTVPVLARLVPVKETASLLTLTGILGVIIGVLYTRFIDAVNSHLRLQLKIGQRIAPYFGHRITKAIHVLRG